MTHPSHSHAQIIATIGPASKDLKIIKSMMEHQMDVARLNFSHGTYEDHAGYIDTIRKVAATLGKKITIIQDLSGPREKTSGGHQFSAEAKRAITLKDIRDLAFGMAYNVDYVALSYVGKKKDILDLRDLITKHGRQTPIIAKIERGAALDHLDEIIDAVDAVMVARGDLGSAIPLEQVPFVQTDIIKKCNRRHKPVIVATQMLLSMVENPQPTRAEVADVSHAISEGADAVMLSEETAIGKYPMEAVASMEQIVLEAEKHLRREKFNLL